MASTHAPALGDRVFACLDALAQLSEQADALTRRALTAPHRDAMAALTDVAVLFVRCAGGISHHPHEAMRRHDAQVAAAVLLELLRALDPAPAAARRR